MELDATAMTRLRNKMAPAIKEFQIQERINGMRLLLKAQRHMAAKSPMGQGGAPVLMFNWDMEKLAQGEPPCK